MSNQWTEGYKVGLRAREGSKMPLDEHDLESEWMHGWECGQRSREQMGGQSVRTRRS